MTNKPRLRNISTLLLLIIFVFLSACSKQEVSIQEVKDRRVELYTQAMKRAYQGENGGNSFIAIKLDSLDGLGLEEKSKILDNFKDISDHVYDFEEVKNDGDKFFFDGDQAIATHEGTVLWVEVKEFTKKDAIIAARSWFGNQGSVYKEYKAEYKGGEWELEEIYSASA